jgi:hypothetical protein
MAPVDNTGPVFHGFRVMGVEDGEDLNADQELGGPQVQNPFVPLDQ